jgi:phosphoglycolate phosphatase
MQSRPRQISSVVFDLDGTLVDSADDIIECLQQAFVTAGISLSIPLTRNHIGPPLTEIIRTVQSGIGDESVTAVVEEFRILYDNGTLQKTVLKNGVAKVLSKLSSMGIDLYVATNKPIIPTKKILYNNRLDMFVDVVTPDSTTADNLDKTGMLAHLQRRWAIDPDGCLMVGDTSSDVYASRNCGIRSVALLDGYGEVNNIIASRPDYVIEQIRDFFFA